MLQVQGGLEEPVHPVSRVDRSGRTNNIKKLYFILLRGRPEVNTQAVAIIPLGNRIHNRPGKQNKLPETGMRDIDLFIDHEFDQQL